MKWVAAAIVAGALAIVLAIVLTRPQDTGIEPGAYPYVSGEWCADHGGAYWPDPQGEPSAGLCEIAP